MTAIGVLHVTVGASRKLTQTQQGKETLGSRQNAGINGIYI